MGYEQTAVWVEAAISGDVSAFDRLYQEKVKSIYYVALKMLGNEQDAEDVVQEVAVKMYQNIGKLRDAKLFSAWLHTIIVNECNSIFRKGKLMKRKTFSSEDLIAYEAELRTEFLPSEYAEQAEKRDSLLSAIDALPKKRRELIVMYYFEGLSCAEIAGLTGTSLSTVTSSLSKAKTQLAEKMENKYGAFDKKIGFLAAAPVISLAMESQADLLLPPHRMKRLLDAGRDAIETRSVDNGLAAQVALPSWRLVPLAAMIVVTAVLASHWTPPTKLPAAFPQKTPILLAEDPAGTAPGRSNEPDTPPDPLPASPKPEGIPQSPGDPPDEVVMEELAVPLWNERTYPSPPSEPGNTGVRHPLPGSGLPEGNQYIVKGRVIALDNDGSALTGSEVAVGNLDVCLMESGRVIGRTTTLEDGSYSFPATKLNAPSTCALALVLPEELAYAPAYKTASAEIEKTSDAHPVINTILYVAPCRSPEGTIILHGGDCDCGHVNPETAMISGGSSLDSYQWQIVRNSDGAVIYTGDEQTLSDALNALYETKADGVYTLQCKYRNTTGTGITAKREIRIYTDEIHPHQFG